MRHVVIVGNQTLGEPKLLAAVQELAAEELSSFEVIVPVTPLTEQEAALRHSEHVANPVGESGAVALARHRLRTFREHLAEVGIDASGELGDPSPLKAITDVLARQPVDVVVISTLAKRRSRWLSADLPRKVERKFAVRVVHVEAPAPAQRAPRHVAAQTVTPLRHTSHR